MRKSIVPAFLVFMFALAGELGAQVEPQRKTVVINGHTGEAQLVQIDGRDYIELGALVQITNGSMSFQNGQTALTLPVSNGAEPQSSADPNRLSREFMKAGIEEIALMREWASPLATAIRNGFPITEQWVADLQSRAMSGLAISSVAASTEGDKNAYALLNHEFELVQQWSNRLVQARKSMSDANYALSQDALRNEPLSQQIINCARFLGTMLTSGSFQDDSSCR